MESAAKGQIVAGEEVQQWLETWGTDKELPAPEIRK
jgi:predicted transcriptional regulator